MSVDVFQNNNNIDLSEKKKKQGAATDAFKASMWREKKNLF